METTIRWLESFFNSLPLPLLEVWGRFGYIVGLGLMVCAFGGITFRPAGRWGFGRERQTWDTQALFSIAFTFVLILVTGFIGSFIVLVPGAQTFESLKDLSVFLCVCLFGYPALITVPIAYGISDLIEGVPPGFVWDWVFGYFINPACFWIAYQLIGCNPDFRKMRVWGHYLIFVVLFICIEPQLWGYLCSGKFTSAIAYGNITPALLFTTGITWLIAPIVMLAAYPLARSCGLFWARIPGHVRHRLLGNSNWIWESGGDDKQSDLSQQAVGFPIRMYIAAPFILLVLVMVVVTAYVVLRSAEGDANKLASRLHQEISQNINLQLDEFLDKSSQMTGAQRLSGIGLLLKELSIAKVGRAFIFDRNGKLIASSSGSSRDLSEDLVIEKAVSHLRGLTADLKMFDGNRQFRFDVLTAKPLSRETWLAQASEYEDKRGDHSDWILITTLPEAYYLEGVRSGNSQSAMVFALALILCLVIAAFLGDLVSAPIRRISRATQALGKGDLMQRLPGSRLEELDTLSTCFNDMAWRLQESFERLQVAIHAASLAVWDWDLKNNLIYWDESMFKQYGLESTGTGRGPSFEDWEKTLIPEDYERATGDVLAALRGAAQFNSEFGIRHSDGTIRYIRGSGRTIRDDQGEPVRMVGVNSDITAQKIAQQELLKHRDNLEELVRERTSALSVAVAQAESATAAKSDFLASMSHEIRTPLNAIIGMTQLALRTELTRKQEDYLNKTIIAANSLLGIINEILDLSKIEAGKLSMEDHNFYFSEIIDHVVTIVGYRASEKGLKFIVDVAPDVPKVLLGDPLRLEQVLINLTNNAVKFTNHGHIVISVNYVDQNSTERIRLFFAVTDSGIGMNEAQRSQIFQPFHQADSSHSRMYGGTGLGLSICKQLVELMGGNIGVKTELGKGSEFYFTADFGFPTKTLGSERRPGIDEIASERVLSKISGLRVLLVEDNEFNQQVASELISEVGGAEVTVAGNGEEALDRLHSAVFDVVLLDIQMPVMDGYEFARRVRSEARFAQLPIIAMTANATASDREQCLAVGMNDFVSKPFVPGDLFQVIANHAGSAKIPRGISFEAGMVHFSSRKSLYFKYLQKFVETRAGAVEDIRRELKKTDFLTAAGMAHTLISVAGMVGAKDLATTLKTLELAILEDESQSFEDILTNLDVKLREAIQGAEQILDSAIEQT